MRPSESRMRILEDKWTKTESTVSYLTKLFQVQIICYMFADR
jgi:hypothetical protein